MSTAYSSDVRSALVARRQWSRISSSSYSAMRIWVLPTSTARINSLLFEVETDVEHRRGVGQRAHRDVVDAADPGVLGHGLDRHASADLDEGAAVDRLDGPPDLGERHVVEHHHGGA